MLKNLTMFYGSKRQKSSGKGVARHAKFILKTKNIFSKNPGVTNPGVTRPYSEWPAPTHYLQTRFACADKGERALACLVR